MLFRSELIKYAAESYRRQKYHPVAGIFQFMFNEDWPSLNWGIIDYWRDPKPGYYALATAYQPILPSAVIKVNKKKVEIQLWITNDFHQSFDSTFYEYEVHLNNDIIKQEEIQINIVNDSNNMLKTFSITDLSNADYELELRCSNKTGKILGLNNYRFSIK